MLLHSVCCYVEDVVTLKMLLRWRCCCVEDVVRLKMLLHSICCYVEDVVTLKMLLRSSCSWVEEKTDSCPFRPWFSGGLWHVYVYHKKPENPKNTQFLREKKQYISWWTWKRQNNVETADNISQICCPHVELIADILKL